MSIVSTNNNSNPTIKHLRIYLNLLGEDTTGVMLHVWNNEGTKNYYGDDTRSDAGIPIDGIASEYGVYWDLPIFDNKQGKINLLPYKQDRQLLPKSVEVDINLASQSDYQIYSFKDQSQIYYEALKTPPLAFNGALAHWISTNTLLMPADIHKVELYHSAIGKMRIYSDKVECYDNKIEALNVEASMNANEKSWHSRFPHLHYLRAWRLPLNPDFAPNLIFLH